MNPTTALLVLDMQNYFFNTPQKREAFPGLLQSVNELAAHATNHPAWCTINISSVHKADRSTWSRNMLQHDGGCLIEGTEEAESVAGLELDAACTVFVKTRHSAFVRTELEKTLRDRGIERIVLAGVYTHGCIALTAIDAWSLDFEVIVASDCVTSHRTDIAIFVIERLRNMFNIEFMTNAELCNLAKLEQHA